MKKIMGDRGLHITYGFLKSCFIIFLAVFIGGFSYFTLASVGAFIVGELLGYRFAAFHLWGVHILRENGKIKARFGKFTFFPSVQMFQPKKHSALKKIIYEAAPAYLGIVAIIIAIWKINHMRASDAREILIAVTIVLLCHLVIHAINFIKIIKYIFGNGAEAVLWRENDRINELLAAGVQPKDIEFLLPDDGESFGKLTTVNANMRLVYDFRRYYHSLELGRYDECSYYVKKMEESLTGSWLPSNTLHYYEILYFYTAVRKDLSKAETYFAQVDSVLEKDMDINGRRVYAAYLFYSGKDINRAVQVAEEGLKVVEQFPQKGLAYMERDFITKMLFEMKD